MRPYIDTLSRINQALHGRVTFRWLMSKIRLFVESIGTTVRDKITADNVFIAVQQKSEATCVAFL